MTSQETNEIARICEDIERTREAMAGTINAIQGQLSPQHIAGQVRQSVQGRLERRESDRSRCDGRKGRDDDA